MTGVGAAVRPDTRYAGIRERLGDAALYRRMRDALATMEAELARLCGETPSKRIRGDLERIIGAGGKRLRPALAYICWHMGVGGGSGENSRIIPLMCMLELMHTVSLIHDDVVDGAEKRRGVATVNASSGVDAAVRSGDFLLSKAMKQLRHYRGEGINEVLAEVSAEMCLGELRQQRVCYDSDAQSEAFYYSQIGRKTAGLLSASCCAGALAGNLPEAEAKALGRFGERFGLAFQILDDLLDYGSETIFGRASGQDIRNGVLTLPILLLRDEWSAAVGRLLRERRKTDCEIRFIVDYVRGTDVVARVAKRIASHCGEARDALSALRASAERSALLMLAEGLATEARGAASNFTS
jgi:geranylgeranyl pyrophosphate synthase